MEKYFIDTTGLILSLLMALCIVLTILYFIYLKYRNDIRYILVMKSKKAKYELHELDTYPIKRDLLDTTSTMVFIIEKQKMTYDIGYYDYELGAWFDMNGVPLKKFYNRYQWKYIFNP